MLWIMWVVLCQASLLCRGLRYEWSCYCCSSELIGHPVWQGVLTTPTELNVIGCRVSQRGRELVGFNWGDFSHLIMCSGATSPASSSRKRPLEKLKSWICFPTAPPSSPPPTPKFMKDITEMGWACRCNSKSGEKRFLKICLMKQMELSVLSVQLVIL